MIKKYFPVTMARDLALPAVTYFETKTLNIFRANDIQRSNGRFIYIMSINIGTLTPLNYALATMFEVLFEKELKIQMCIEKGIAISARTRISIILDKIVLQLMLLGQEELAKVEKAMEFFLASSKHVAESAFNEDYMAIWKTIALSNIIIEKNSVRDYAVNDADDMYLTTGQFLNLRRKAVDIIKNKLTTDDAMTFLKRKIINGARVIVELYNGKDFESPINPKSEEQTLRRQVSVHKLFDTVLSEKILTDKKSDKSKDAK